MASQRVLRSATRRMAQAAASGAHVPPISESPDEPQHPSLPRPFTFSSDPSGMSSIRTVAGQPPVRLITKRAKLPHISASELKMLREKQAKLRSNIDLLHEATSIDGRSRPEMSQALSKTLIFARPQAGTAVCVSSDGWILTYAEGFQDKYDRDRESWRETRYKWLIYYNGTAVLVECQHVDFTRNLALARVIAVELDAKDFVASSLDVPEPVAKHDQLPLSSNEPSLRFSAMSIVRTEPVPYETRIFCIGQPNRDDWKTMWGQGPKTERHLFEVSKCTYQGLRPDVDLHDCSFLGTLIHNAWTYWGHPGAPLVRLRDGEMIGIHTNWDEETWLNNGVPWMAILHFLEEAGVDI